MLLVDNREAKLRKGNRVLDQCVRSDHELRLTAGEWWDRLADYVVAHDEPNANGSMVSLYALATLAAREVRVVLNGTGGDELFGGYEAHRLYPAVMARQDAVRRWLPSSVRTAIGRNGKRGGSAVK